MKWYQTPQAAVIWTVMRVWLGIQWLEAGLHKVTGEFDASGFLQGALAKATGENPAVQGWYAAFLENVAIPNVKLFNILIPYGEVFVGVGLIIGAATIPALLAGVFMNLNFLLAGTVSTNPVLLTAAVILLFVGAGAYYFGVDRFAIPALKQYIGQRRRRTNQHKRAAAH
ncbi:doxX family protein [Anoxybacillus sp. B7M1]|uniref:DoxX family protein n=1 Tax=unclassified Anoxybacillus TaxID=2639704 RepID=UPI0005CD7B94|nr:MULTISPECIES: DoxX family membrane protein [unclassified Anoxybacillus]ANB58616.1 doxX family protein [Anoxybacillus sp. B2M1]ANB63386.1 doxX family protein [Anoxybacillus sp. B7M1]